MNCHDVRKRLEQLTEDRDQQITDQILKHAAECSSCQNEVAAFRLLDSSISSWIAAVPSVDLVHVIVASAVTERPPRLISGGPSSPNSRTSTATSALICVSVCVVTLIATVFHFAGTNSREPNVVHSDVVVPYKSKFSLANALAEADDVWNDFAEETVGSAISVEEAYLPATPTVADADVSPRLDGPGRFAWLSDVGDDFKPIATDVQDSVRFLWELIPDDSPAT